jgi:ABC-type branched-subunit amino acid transport system substrate-binding protein
MVLEEKGVTTRSFRYGTHAPTRRAVLGLVGASGAALLAGCRQMDGMALAPQGANASQAPRRSLDVGSGPVTVALVAPLSASGGAGTVGKAIGNAANMAVEELAQGDLRLVVKDDRGSPAGATAATNEAIAEGAQVILGPLFGPSVSAAGAVARSAGIPMIAFSSDASAAAPGVYLLSFMPQSDVERIVAYAAQSGRTSHAALVPETAYGSVVQGEFMAVSARHGVRVVGVERYPVDRIKMQEPIARLAATLKAGQADALFLPEGGDALPEVARSLSADGVDPRSLQLLGTGVWEDRRVFAEPLLQGGLYAAPDAQGFAAFATRYRARFDADPVRLASVGYDGVSLVAGLIRTYGAQAFDPANVTKPSGFSGIDGAFRFRPDGTSERSLAVLKVTPQGGETVSPAQRSFTA